MRRFAIFAIAALLCGGGFWTATGGFSAAFARAEDAKTAAFPLEKMREFAEVFRIVKENYVEEISDEELMERAIRGMIGGLDPHSAYLTARHLESFTKEIHAEEYGGVGLYIGEKGGWVEVVSPIDETPASRAGILPGDIVVKIDGLTTQGMAIDEAVRRMRGVVDTVVSLDVVTPGADGPRAAILRREIIAAPTAIASLAEKDYGYLRINRFQVETVADTVKAVNKLYAENGRPLRGLVLDLRNNPGGLLHTSLGVASIFLPAGVTVVSDRGRTRENHLVSAANLHHGLENEKEIKQVRMVVLVNNGSASASEIVAGALQDHRRAVIMGQRTYGKASVQSFLRLPSAAGKTAVKLTTARYFTPHNRSIQAVGIAPDIVVFAARSVEEPDAGLVLRESDLARHLQNENAPAENSGRSGGSENSQNAVGTGDFGDAEADAGTPFIPQDDYQYDQALVVLKALSVGG
ncbi:MAG: S41 family peptidase [Gammaproteobacteria bacterium]